MVKSQRRIIAIIGGIASGKSAVRQILEEQGAQVLDADSIAHEVLERREVAEQVAKQFQLPGFIQPDVPNTRNHLLCSPSETQANSGLAPYVTVDRKQLAKVVFAKTKQAEKALDDLEAIVQPKIAETIHREIDQWRCAKGPDILVLDIPLLFERGWEKQCDQVWFVDTPLEMRQQFAAKRGWTKEQLEAREQAQMPIKEKRERADFVLDNSGTLDELTGRVKALIEPFSNADSNR